MTTSKTFKISGFNLNHIGWRYYNNIKKKAVEQEFSWSGLALSLSIAFFIVFTVAVVLNFVNKSFEKSNKAEVRNIYQLEARSEYLQDDLRILGSSSFFNSCA